MFRAKVGNPENRSLNLGNNVQNYQAVKIWFIFFFTKVVNLSFYLLVFPFEKTTQAFLQ